MKLSISRAAIVAAMAAALVFPTAMLASNVENEDFAVTLPEGYSEFAHQVQKVASPSGEIHQSTWVSKGADGSAFIVTYGDLSGPITDPEAAMTSGRDSLLKSLNASLEQEREIEIDGNPARTFEFSSQGETPIFARTDLAVTGPRMYQVIFLGFSEEARQSAGVDQFFRSFDIRYEPQAPNTAPAAQPETETARNEVVQR